MSLVALFIYWTISAALWLGLSVLAYRLFRRAPVPAGVAAGDGLAARNRAAIAAILAIAVLVRLMIVFTLAPTLSDDIVRYEWDGIWFAQAGMNPYDVAPADFGPQRGGLGLAPNHPHLLTVYQPTSQWVFAFASVLSSILLWLPAHVAFRLVFLLFDLFIICLLMLKLLRDGRALGWVCLYAFHPLVLTEVAWSGHQDVVGIAWVLMTLMLVDDRGLWDWSEHEVEPGSLADAGRAMLAGGAFALAIGVKPVVIPLALPLVWAWRRHAGRIVIATLACLVTLAALYLPFALMEGGLARMLDTVRQFMAHWRFNGSVHPLLESLSASKRFADVACGLALLGVLVVATLRTDLWRATLIYLFAALLLSSTVHPWYLLWALALVPVRFNLAVWVWSLTITWSYVVLLDREAWHLPGAVLWLEYVPVYLAILWLGWSAWVRRIRAAPCAAASP